MTKLKPNWIKKIKLVAWDLDGTLYPSHPDLKTRLRTAMINAVAQQLNFTFDEARQKFDQTYSKLHSSTKTLYSYGIDGHSLILDFWDSVDFSKYIQRDKQLIKMFDSFSRLNVNQAMLTNSNTIKSIRKKINCIGLSEDIFNPIITSVAVGFNKPDLKIFRELIKQSNLDPDQILYVGDREEVDIVPARKLGMYGCLVYAKESCAELNIAQASDLIDLFI